MSQETFHSAGRAYAGIWEPKAELLGCVVDIQSMTWIASAFLAPLVLGYVIRKQPAAGFALLVVMLAQIVLFDARIQFIGLSVHGEPTPYVWSSLLPFFWWALPALAAGYLGSMLIAKAMNRVSVSKRERAG